MEHAYFITDDIISALTDLLASNAKLKLFAFLDTASENKMILDLRDQDPEADYELLFDNLIDAEPSPILVELLLESPFLTGLIEREQKKHDADFSLFLSSIPLKEQLTHWQNRLMVRDLDGRKVLFRYFDPRVWFSFLDVSTPEERHASLGPAQRVWMHAKQNTWLGFENPQTQSIDKDKDKNNNMKKIGIAATPTILLRQEHKDSAENLAELNFSIRLRDYLRDEIPEDIEDLQPNTLQYMIVAGIRRAKSHGLITEANITAWVQIMFQIAPNFDQQAAIRDALENCPNNHKDKLDYVFDHTSDDDWDKAEDIYDADAWAIT